MRNFAGNVFMSSENGVANIKKVMIFFGNLEIYSQIPVSKHKVWLRIFHCPKDRVQLVYHNAYNFFAITWVSPALCPPCALVTA